MNGYLDFRDNFNSNELKNVSSNIKNGAIAIFPTETVYGIGVNALNVDAVKKLYEVKHRPLNKPISLLVSDMNMINMIAKNISNIEYKLMEAFFPGPLTIILEKKDIVSNIVTSNNSTVGVRMPANNIALELIKYAKVPLATSSANISGNASGTTLNSIIKDFLGKVDYFIDSGECKLKTPSTIVKVVNGIPRILRQGSISLEEIEKVCSIK